MILKNLKSTNDTADGSSSDTSSVVKVSKNPLHVKFNSIQVRYYDITLGDNPSCTYGPPVTLDWNYDEMESIPIDSYEEGKKNPPRKMHQMHMLSRHRANLLKIAAETFIMDNNVRIGNMIKKKLPFLKLKDAVKSALKKWKGSRRTNASHGSSSSDTNSSISGVTKRELAIDLDTTASRPNDTSDGSSSDTSSVVARKKKAFHVKFNSIQVRYYDITLGDNPSCMHGPPVTLDWNYDEMEPVAVDSFEEGRGRPPHKRHQMLMLSRQRANLLKIAAGIADAEMIAVMDEMHKIQKKRRITNMTFPLFKLQNVVESAWKRWKRP